MNEIQADITALSHDGRGVAHIDGKTVFVPDVLPGERVRLRIVRRHRRYDEGVLLELLSHSPERVSPRCPHFLHCSGCTLQHLSVPAQIAAKQNVLADNFERIGKVVPERWLPALQDELWGYRRKGRLSVRWIEKKGRVLVGFRETNPRYVADLQACDVLHPTLGLCLGELAEQIGHLSIRTHIPQIEFAAGDEALVLVIRHTEVPSASDCVSLAAFGDAHGLSIWLQAQGPDSAHPMREQDQVRLAYRVQDDLLITFQPLDFIQIHSGMNRCMVDQALALLEPSPQHRILDLFSGIGNFTLPMARHAAEVTGIEGESGLVQRAIDNAHDNGIENAHFHSADLFKDQRATSWAQQSWDAIVLDPPRAGAAELLDYLPGAATHKLLYISCHPASLARDAGTLVHRHGFQLQAAGVMDMFPHTSHVESMALFTRD